MSLIVPFRSYNRKRSARVGGKSFTDSKATYVNVDNPRVKRDLAARSAIGSFFVAGNAFEQLDDGVVDAGGKVTTRATTLVVDISAVNATRANGTKVSNAADTVTIGAADATNPRIDLVALNTASPDIVVVAGTATAGATLNNLSGKPAVPANRIALAYILVPATATTLVQTNVVDVRP